jgi:hypothetical protein
MAENYWHRQTLDNPLFPDLLWSRPENKRLAGKLLIIGGNARGFAIPAEAYNEALKAGAGAVKVLLPEALKKIIGQSFEAAEFAPSTTSGSFSQPALAEILDLDHWADGVLIAGELGRNAETAAVLENYTTKSVSLITIARDAVNYFYANPQSILSRPNTTLVLSLAQLQRLNKEVKYPQAITFSMDMLRLVEWLHSFTSQYAANLIVKHLGNIFVAGDGQVSSTKLVQDIEIWRLKTAALAAVWWLQNPSKAFEALSASVGTLTHH